MRLTVCRPLLTATALALAACADTDTTAPTRATLPPDAIASLPLNLWTTRVNASDVEAIVSNGSARLGFACDAGSGDPRTVMRYVPSGGGGSGEHRIEVAAFGGVRVGATQSLSRQETPTGPALVGSAPASDADMLRLVRAMATGGADVSVRNGAATTRFSLNGAGEALAGALSPGGCLPRG